MFGDVDDNDIGAIFYEHGSNKLNFRTNTSTRMSIDSSGNVGFEVTPHSFHTDRTGLAIGGSGIIESSTTAGAGNFLKIGQNAYWDGSKDATISNDESSYYLQESGKHRFFTAPAHATTATLTEKFMISEDGDVVIITDGKSIKFGVDSDVSLTHLHNAGLLLDTSKGLFFRDHGGEYIYSAGDGDLRIHSGGKIHLGANVGVGELTPINYFMLLVVI